MSVPNRTLLLIFVSALSFYLLFNSQIPVTDPVEANYALTAKEMMESGDWLSPRIYGEFWFDKPVITYWLIGLSYVIFGVNEFAARFPSALFSAGSVTLAYWFAFRLYGHRQVAFLAALVLGTSLEYWVLARMIITDAILFFFTSTALASFYLGLRHQRQGWFILAYASTGLAVLTKGPVGLVLPGMIVGAYVLVSRQWNLLSRLYLFRGLVVFLAVAAPWYWVMYTIHGMDFVNTFLGLHNYLRATVSEHPQDNVFYYYLVLFPVSLLPWSGVLVGALMSRRLTAPAHSVYLLTWIAVIVVFYSLMATKYLTYVFPASFPAAILIGYYLQQFRIMAGRRRWLWLSVPACLQFILFGLGTKWLPEANWLVLYGAIIAAIMGIIWLQLRGKVRLLPETVAFATVVISMIVIAYGLIPVAESRSGKEAVQSIPAQAELAIYGYYSTSAVFYTGITARLLSDEVESGGDVWSKKYNIPQISFSELQLRIHQSRDIYLLVRPTNLSDFLHSPLANQFHQTGEYRKFLLYKRNESL